MDEGVYVRGRARGTMGDDRGVCSNSDNRVTQERTSGAGPGAPWLMIRVFATTVTTAFSAASAGISVCPGLAAPQTEQVWSCNVLT